MIAYDVVVVGTGNAALCAALSAREQNKSVVVLERAPEEEKGGNSRYTAGAVLGEVAGQSASNFIDRGLPIG